MQNELKRRLAGNESVFRSVNEGIKRGRWPGEDDEPIGFRCECARLGCNGLVMLTRAEYDYIRSDPRRFVMIAGHATAVQGKVGAAGTMGHPVTLAREQRRNKEILDRTDISGGTVASQPRCHCSRSADR